MYMKQNNILDSLKQRAQEQQVVYKVPFPHFFLFLSKTLGENPWRVLIPIAFFLTIIFHLMFGNLYDERILWLFGAL